MYTWILENPELSIFIISSLISLVGVVVHLYYKVRIHSRDIRDTNKKIKILEDAVRCRDEAILNKLDKIVDEVSAIKTTQAELIGWLSAKGFCKQ